MNREIKVRAWDKESKKFVFEGNLYQFEICAKLDAQWLKSKLEWIEFTGLKDKNRKEIYEGDIVKISPESPNTEFVEVIKWVDQTNWMAEKCPINGFVNHESIYKQKPEIIGNIYENPELLTYLLKNNE